jgi:hypothetical protein
MIVYIHGFNSSSASVKAHLMHEALLRLNRGHELLAPELPHLPSLAMQKLEQEITRHGTKQIAVIEGGDHGFRNFSDYVPVILEFAGE